MKRILAPKNGISTKGGEIREYLVAILSCFWHIFMRANNGGINEELGG
jgi:hypothetical protein